VRRAEVVHVAPSFAWEGGLITLGRGALIEWFGHPTVSDYGLKFSDGADPARIKSQVQEFVADSPVETTVYTGAEGIEFIFSSVNSINQLFRAMSSVVVGAATLAILNALLISVVERRRELGIMRALGTGRRQLRRMVGFEATSIGVVASLFGAGVGFLVHRTALAALNAQTGYPIAYDFVARPAATAVALGILMAAIGSLLPAIRAGSVNIIEAIGYE
jgi:putative ABC transport system permease protein